MYPGYYTIFVGLKAVNSHGRGADLSCRWCRYPSQQNARPFLQQPRLFAQMLTCIDKFMLLVEVAPVHDGRGFAVRAAAVYCWQNGARTRGHRQIGSTAQKIACPHDILDATLSCNT